LLQHHLILMTHMTHQYAKKQKRKNSSHARMFVKATEGPRSKSKCNTFSVENLLHAQDLQPSEPGGASGDASHA
jgi:hypothetical protein